MAEARRNRRRKGQELIEFSMTALLLAGCLSRPPLRQELFAFEPTVKPLPGAANTNVLSLRLVSVNTPFNEISFVYKTGPQRFETDPNAAFMATPEHLLFPAIQSGLRQSGVFAQIIEPNSALRPTLALEVRVSELYGDFSNPSQPEAVFSAEFILINVGKDASGAQLLDARLGRRVPLKDRTAAAVAQALNTALEQVLAEAAAKLAAR